MSENENDEQKQVEASSPVEEAQTVNADSAEATSQPDATAQTNGAATVTYRNPFARRLDNFFGVTKSGSTIKVEVIAGLTTFMAMVYILMVNSDMFTVLGVSYGAIYIATALSAIVGTMLMALLARLPMAQASGMGLNAFFVFTICLGFGLSYANALVLVLIDGVVFVVLTATGLRKMLFNAIPKAVRIAIPAGIGLFIAFIGLQNVGFVVADGATLVKLASFNLLGSATYGSIMPLLVTFLGVVAMAIMSKRKMKGAVLWAILGASGLYYALMGLGCAWKDPACLAVFNGFAMSNPFHAFRDWGTQSVGQVFASGFDFSAYLAVEGNNGGTLALLIITSSLAFCMVDLFDTMGTLYGAAARGNMLDKDGNIPNMNKAMMCDAIATCTGAVCGTSTVTTFVESSAGIGAGGKTGMTSLITALCFFVAMFLSPIAQLIPGAATASALIYVGVLMMNCVREIEWTDAADAVPAFLTIAMMSFTYNISYGIAFGIISWLLIKLCTGKVKDIHPVTVVIGVLFLLMFLLTH